MLLLTLHLLTAVPAPQLPAAVPSSVRLLDRELMLAQAPEAGEPQAAARDPFAGGFNPVEAIVAALGIIGADSIVGGVTLLAFVVLAPSLAGDSGLLILSLLAVGATVVDALVAPLVAAAIVGAMAAGVPTGGGFGGALSSAAVMSGLSLLLMVGTAFTPLLAAVNPILALVGVALGIVGGSLHLIGVPIAASFGLHRVSGSQAPAAPTALALSGPAASMAGPMPALVLARF